MILALLAAPPGRGGAHPVADAIRGTDAAQAPDVRVDERSVLFDGPALPYVEPVIAVNPTDADNIVAAAVVVGEGWTPVALVTTDGGGRWERRELGRQDEVRVSGDPWLYWAGDVVHLSVLAFVPWGNNDDRVAIWVYRSTDGGLEWTGPEQVPWPERGSYDHPIVVGDGSLGGRTPLYLVATVGLSGLAVLRSAGGGEPFGAPELFAPDARNNNLGGVVALGDDEVLFTHFDMSTAGPERPLWAVRSVDRGASFERRLITRGVMPWGFPMLAVDRGGSPHRGRVYSVWLEADGDGGLGVIAAHSDDLGASWSDGVVVDDDPPGTFRGRPYVAVNDDGVVGISWNDRRHNAADQCSDTYFTFSSDGGDAFAPALRLSSATSCPHGDPGNRAAAERWQMGGDYSGVGVAPDGAFHVIWSDARDGLFRLFRARVLVR